MSGVSCPLQTWANAAYELLHEMHKYALVSAGTAEIEGWKAELASILADWPGKGTPDERISGEAAEPHFNDFRDIRTGKRTRAFQRWPGSTWRGIPFLCDDPGAWTVHDPETLYLVSVSDSDFRRCYEALNRERKRLQEIADWLNHGGRMCMIYCGLPGYPSSTQELKEKFVKVEGRYYVKDREDSPNEDAQ